MITVSFMLTGFYFLHLAGLLGADKIFFYDLQVHPNITKVFNHYENLEMVHVTPLTLPGRQPNLPQFRNLYFKGKNILKQLDEVISFNDCFYKHMYEYKYIAVLDIDEVIMPIQVKTWKELMNTEIIKAKKVNKTYSCYRSENVYFLDQLRHSYSEDVPRSEIYKYIKIETNDLDCSILDFSTT